MFQKPNTLLLIVFIWATPAYSQNWSWIKNGAGERIANIKGNAVAIDRLFNTVVVTGSDSLNWGPGGPPNAFYITKYDQTGNLLWEKKCTGTKQAFDVEIDSRGYVYILSQRYTLYENTPVNPGSLFCLTKTDPFGRLLWVKPIDALNTGQIFELAFHKPIIEIDNNDNIFFGASIYTENFRILDSSYAYPAVSSGDVLIAKIDTTGSVKWSRRFIVGGGFNNYTGGVFDIDANPNGKIAIGGFFDATILINGQSFSGVSGSSNPLGRTPFLAVLNSADGSTVFAKAYTSNYTNNYITGVILKSNGDVVSCARVRGGVFFIAGSTLLWGGTDMFFTDSGGTDNPSFKQLSGELNYHYLDFEDDANGNIYASCAVLWPNNGNPNDSFNVRVQRFDAGGNFLYHSTVDFQNKYYTRYVYIKTRGTFVAVTGAVVPRSPEIRIGNNVITGGPDSVCSFAGSILERNCLATGRIFYDLNLNGVQDAGEPGFPYQLIAAPPGAAIGYSQLNGDYRVYTDTGSFSLSPPNPPRYHLIVPASHPISFTGYNQRIDNRDFAFQQIPNIRDLRIDFSPAQASRPGFPLNYYVHYSNVGTTTLSGNYSLKFTSNFDFLSSDSATSFLNTDSASWNYTNLAPGQSRYNVVRLRLKGSVPLGFHFLNTAYIYPIIGDTVPSDNIYVREVIARGAYDPNDKLVDPSNPVLIDSAQTGKQFIEYTARFQNTGNDTAFQIRVLDTLSALLDTKTFEVVAASHPSLIVNLRNSRNVEFYFANIQLPDSFVNEPRSHGFIKFRIKPLTTVQLGDTIKNSASIYFDYNAPVKTNTTNTTFRNNIVTGIGGPSITHRELRVHPNPATNSVRYSMSAAPVGTYTLSLYDMNGKLLSRQNIRNSTIELTGVLRLDMQKGVYIIELRRNGIITRGKLIKL